MTTTSVLMTSMAAQRHSMSHAGSTYGIISQEDLCAVAGWSWNMVGWGRVGAAMHFYVRGTN
jgi:hypothetical protein